MKTRKIKENGWWATIFTFLSFIALFAIWLGGQLLLYSLIP